MDLKEKRRLEIEDLKEKRRKEVIISAISVFKANGILNAKMTDIAEEAEIGIATLYRYFKTKTDLTIETGVYLWKNEINHIYKDFYESSYQYKNGLEKLRGVLNIFIKMYKEHPEILSLLEHFDNYIVKENIPQNMLDKYEDSILDMKFIIIDAIEQGKKDGSIKENIDTNSYYITITHTLTSLSQKLILRGKILTSDTQVEGEKQLELIIDMAINYLIK